MGHAAEGNDPLFLSLDRQYANTEARTGLTRDGLHDLVRCYGAALGMRLASHNLHHSAMTAAPDAMGGGVRKVQNLLRHAYLRTLTIYDVNRADLQGEVTGLLSGLL